MRKILNGWQMIVKRWSQIMAKVIVHDELRHLSGAGFGAPMCAPWVPCVAPTFGEPPSHWGHAARLRPALGRPGRSVVALSRALRNEAWEASADPNGTESMVAIRFLYHNRNIENT